jgi:hypothetical protein
MERDSSTKVTLMTKHAHLELESGENELRGVVKTRNAGISRNMAEYHGISRNMAEYHGIWRNITEYHDIVPEYTGISRYFPMVAMRLFINMDV